MAMYGTFPGNEELVRILRSGWRMLKTTGRVRQGQPGRTHRQISRRRSSVIMRTLVAAGLPLAALILGGVIWAVRRR